MSGTWEWFIEKFEQMSYIDLTAYKRPQMERRINSFMRTVNAGDYTEFVKLLHNDKQIYRRFLEHITINVSEFFRNRNHWEILEKDIIPALTRQRSRLKIWSAGCSTGEEPYSLAMLVQEKHLQLADKILATDIDRDVLSKAEAGIYTQKAVEGVPGAYLKRYFEHQGDFFSVNEGLKKMVNFQYHNLLRDSFKSDFDLILCRNVVIYFTEETKEQLYRKFAAALRPGGIMFIGSTEQIFQSREIGLKSAATFFYQKE